MFIRIPDRIKNGSNVGSMILNHKSNPEDAPLNTVSGKISIVKKKIMINIFFIN